MSRGAANASPCPPLVHPLRPQVYRHPRTLPPPPNASSHHQPLPWERYCVFRVSSGLGKSSHPPEITRARGAPHNPSSTRTTGCKMRDERPSFSVLFCSRCGCPMCQHGHAIKTKRGGGGSDGGHGWSDEPAAVCPPVTTSGEEPERAFSSWRRGGTEG